MASYAVVLVGIPARIATALLDELRRDLATDHVILSDLAQNYSDKYARYDEVGIKRALGACVTAVFGRATRPVSFCRNSSQSCFLRSGGSKKKCGGNSQTSCGLTKPDHLIVLYQVSKNDSPLLEALSFSAYARPIPQACYDRLQATKEHVLNIIKFAKKRLAQISVLVNQTTRTPLLLPIRNFNPGLVLNTLKRVASDDDGKAISKKFIENHWVEVRSVFSNGGRLYFKPTSEAVAHGGKGGEDNDKRALASTYRLGCSYRPGFHYDVEHQIAANLAGVEFTCSRAGVYVCKNEDRYANIYPNDLIRTASMQG